MRTGTVFTMAVVLSMFFTGPAAAQTQITTTVIEGIVVDTSGAVLPGVDVTVKNVDTNLTRTLVTDRSGRFVALQLPPGRYTVTFTLAGFATLVQEDVVVTVGEARPARTGHEGVGRRRDGHGHDAVVDGRDDTDGRRQHAERDDRSKPRRFSGASSRTC